jgi:hypothetical protein
MPGIQELIALGIVALVAGRLLWRRWFRARAGGKAGACGDCASSGPPPKEAPVRFYRRRKTAEGPASGAPKNSP